MMRRPPRSTLFLFFFNDTATTEIYTLSLHDALPIYGRGDDRPNAGHAHQTLAVRLTVDRKSTRLNSSHGSISYAVFCLQTKLKSASTRTSRRACTCAHANAASSSA